MDNTTIHDAKAENADSPKTSYLRGLCMSAARIVAVIIIIPVLMWKAAQAYSHRPEAAEQAASAASLKATVAGGGILSIGGIAANDIAIIGGLVLGVAGFVTQWYYQRRRDKREQREHDLRVSQFHKEQE